ncbi:MAG TPA: hypothetical protein VMP03_09525 [Methylomirabilota bacterium]|nr:hypothetical protein [Methylomirabilota bacterium]
MFLSVVVLAGGMAYPMLACTPRDLVGEWSLSAVKTDQMEGPYACILGLDRGGHVTWSHCRVTGDNGFEFEIEGCFAIDSFGRIEGRVWDAYGAFAVEAKLASCGIRTQDPVRVKGTVVPLDGWIRPIVPFRGARWPEKAPPLEVDTDDGVPPTVGATASNRMPPPCPDPALKPGGQDPQ